MPPNLILTPGGQHVVVVSVLDNADNLSSAEVKFGVDISIDGLLATRDTSAARPAGS